MQNNVRLHVKITEKKFDLHFKTLIRLFYLLDLALPDYYLFQDPCSINVTEKRP